MEDDMSSPLMASSGMSSYRTRANSECDTANEAGNYTVFDTAGMNDSGTDGFVEAQRQRWDLNYREAAIFLREGENNDKFTSHPRHQVDLKAYMIAHSTYFYLLSFGAALLLLSMAVIEPPAVRGVNVPIPVHACLELLGLTIIAVELAMKIKWLGIRMVVSHVRTMIKAVVLAVMFVEAIVVLIRMESHIRVTRALRPVFLLDAHYCRGVRRFIRQIIQSMSPIIDMLILLIFFILLFSMLGFYLFSNMPNDSYFRSFSESFISLFILLTSANFPDVMMPSYKSTRWSAVFFIVYVSLEIFLFMNLFLAVVYSSFLSIEKEKLKKLLLHRRQACHAAFQLLVSSQNPHKVSLRHFAGCLKYFRPRMSRRDVYLSFKLLNTSRTGRMEEDEFASVYDVVSLRWKEKSEDLWSANFVYPFNRICYRVYQLVSQKWFEYFVYVVILSNFIWSLVDVTRISVIKSRSNAGASFNWFEEEQKFLWISVLFVSLYIVETALKLCGFGPVRYFSSGWNVFDFVVIVVSLGGLLLQFAFSGFYYTVVLRPLRVLRLFKLKRRYRDIFGTLFILFSRMISVAVAILLLYYFFAIIGMEVFAPYTSQLKNCCRNTSVEQFYMYDNVTGLDGYYYLNTFENILTSSVTLFELTVVNNWWIVMEGFANVVSEWTRIYFMLFYLFIMIVMTVVVAFILEAFIFRIQYRMTLKPNDTDGRSVRQVNVELTIEELQMCDGTTVGALSGRYIAAQQETESLQMTSQQQTVCFCGEKLLSKNDFSLQMYGSQVQEWIAEYKTTLQQTTSAGVGGVRAFDSQVSLAGGAASTSDSEYTAVVV